MRPDTIDTRSVIPLACVPGAIVADEREGHFALVHRLFGEEAQERRDEPDGFTFRFDAALFDDVTRYVVNERRCCPFLTFEISLSAAEGPLWLRLRRPAGTREFLLAAFANLSGADAAVTAHA